MSALAGARTTNPSTVIRQFLRPDHHLGRRTDVEPVPVRDPVLLGVLEGCQKTGSDAVCVIRIDLDEFDLPRDPLGG